VLGSGLLAATILVAGSLLSFLVAPWGALLLLALIYPAWQLVWTALLWYNKRYIITNRRVIEVEGVFDKVVSDSSLEKVSDVVLEQSALGRLLGYGDIEILTASEVGIDHLEFIADPIRFKVQMLDQKELLSEGREGAKGRHAGVDGVGDAVDASRLLQALDDLRRGGVLSPQEFRDKKKRLSGGS